MTRKKKTCLHSHFLISLSKARSQARKRKTQDAGNKREAKRRFKTTGLHQAWGRTSLDWSRKKKMGGRFQNEKVRWIDYEKCLSSYKILTGV